MSGKRAKRRRRERKQQREAVQPKNRPAVMPANNGVSMFPEAGRGHGYVANAFDDPVDSAEVDAEAV